MAPPLPTTSTAGRRPRAALFLLRIFLLLVCGHQHRPAAAAAFGLAVVGRRCRRLGLSASSGGEQRNDDRGGDGRRDFLRRGAASGAAASVSIFAGGGGPFRQRQRAAAAEPRTMKKDLRDVRVALWGFGNQNKLMAKYLHERGVPIVAVVSHHDIGKDYTAVDLGPWGKKIGGRRGSGVEIVGEEDAEAALRAARPDVCLLCTRSTLQDLMPALAACAASHVNVVTIGEEVLNAWTSSPTLAKDVDALFRENGVTLTGSGFEDMACCEMAMLLSSTMHRIDAVQGYDQFNLDEYGLVLAEEFGAGLTPAQFRKQFVDTPQPKSVVYNVNEWFVSALDLTLVETKERREPTFTSAPLWSRTLGKEIPAGDCTGMKIVATTTTKEGVSVEIEAVGKCYGPGDVDRYTFGFEGEPEGVEFTLTNTPSPAMTNTAAISRILQVLDAPAGYVTSDKLPGTVARYKHWT